MNQTILIGLQRFHHPVLDGFFSLVTNLGSEEFYVIALSLIYWCVGKKLAFRLGVVFLFSNFVNVYLKNLWRVARPIGYPGIRSLMVQTAGGYSTPSGHAQGTATFWGYLALKVKNRLLAVWSVLVMLLVGFSRLYLGVHWPADVLLGLVLGLAIAVLFARMEEWWIKKDVNFTVNMMLAVVLPFGLLLLDRSEDMMKVIGFLVGLATGYVMEERWVRFNENQPFSIQVVKLLVGYTMLLAVRVGVKMLLPVTTWSDLVRYGLIGLLASLGLPYLYKRCYWG